MRNIIFAHSGEHSTPYYNLLEILNFDNVVNFKTAVFTHKILKKEDMPAIFSDFIIPAVDIHSHKTQYANQGNLYRTSIRTNYGEFMFRYRAVQERGIVSHLLNLLLESNIKHFFFTISNSRCHSMPSVYWAWARE